jgi:hypothetical protein
MNVSTGAITGTISVGDAANGPYAVTVVASDGTYSDTETFNWTVNSPISITDQGDQANNAGDVVSVSLGVSDSAGGTPTISATGLPNGTSINASTGLISGTLSAGGMWTPTITVTDGTYTTTDTFNWTVSSPISIADQGDQSNQIGDSVSLLISASDGSGGTPTFSATSLPTGLSIAPATGFITGTVGVSASTSTPYATTITVTDGTYTAVDSFTWTVSPAGALQLTNPGNQTNAAGDLVALSNPATDSSSPEMVYTVSNLPAGLYFNPETGFISAVSPAARCRPARTR